ncbi:MAG: biosynthetic arginine decarboxylase [Verrucomicrobiota bacterium]
MHMDAAWTLEAARDTYNINTWGGGYFDVNRAGQMTVRPLQAAGGELSIPAVVEAARHRGLHFPLLLRFQDLLRHRVTTLNESFAEAMAGEAYPGRYRGVFPLKVNHLREVVEEILEAGRPHHFGLEVGSKPELFAALALHEDPESLIICNGYKDRLFIETALLGTKLGKRVVLVAEKLSDLDSIIAVSRAIGVAPTVGIRLKLQAKGAGRWALSSGDNAKFGLTTSEIMEAVRQLRDAEMGDCLQLMHFHIGSQIPEIQTLTRAVREAARYYAKLRQMGFPLRYLDVGGGLGIDYDGSRTANDSSTNYTMDEYTRTVVATVKSVVEEENVPAPDLVSESGRAIVAPHSVLVLDVFGAIEKTSAAARPEGEPRHRLAGQLIELIDTVEPGTRREVFHDAVQIYEDAQSRFDLGLLDLEAKAQIEQLFWQAMERIVAAYQQEEKDLPEEVRAWLPSLSDKFLCNFSIFQSMVDHWALDQLFPIAPLHRLLEPPTHQATLVDITCDSDGKISKFINGRAPVRETLPLHALNSQPYLLGVFLMGAYQDIMGDLHNLFGMVNEAHVFLDPEEAGGFYIEETLEGSTIGDVLADVQYDKATLLRLMKKQIDAAIRDGQMMGSEGMRWLRSYQNALGGSTYLTHG